ncbi:MAG: efflux RND transporter periplasmic adaptor subunit [Campylobacterales bacterium]|nr:efflux RND transporter periplasmic adaptor subunit [Campylobacterales bacterium]
MDKKISTTDILSTLESEQNQQSFWRRHWAKILVVFLIGVWGYFYTTLQNQEELDYYNTTTLTKRDLVIKVSATGNLEPTNSVDVGIEVSGTMAEVLVDYNDKVTKGQVLAKLDTTKLLSQVNNSKASLEVAKANLKESEISILDTKQELERLEQLYRSTHGNYPTRQEIDKAKIVYAKAKALYNAYQAKVSQAKAVLKANEDDLNKAIVVSPIEGIVLNKQIEAGQSVVANMTIPILFTLAQDLRKMRAIVSVDEADIGKIKEGQAVEFSVDAYPKKSFKGTITQVRLNAQIVDGVVTYQAVVEVDNANLLLRPGMTVSADIITTQLNNQWVIPNAALRFSPTANHSKARKHLFAARPKKQVKSKNKQKSIWILENGLPVQVQVDIGLSDGTYTVLMGEAVDKNAQIITAIKESTKDE